MLFNPDKYDYSYTNYIDSHNKIIIICPIHGKFEQVTNSHLNGSGCQKCAKVISKKEIKWLDSLSIDNKNRHISLYINNKRYNLDAYDPITNTIYEFYGDFWHGNPDVFDSCDINIVSHKTFGELYNNTIQREIFLKKQGYNIISIWENNFEKYFI